MQSMMSSESLHEAKPISMEVKSAVRNRSFFIILIAGVYNLYLILSDRKLPLLPDGLKPIPKYSLETISPATPEKEAGITR